MFSIHRKNRGRNSRRSGVSRRSGTATLELALTLSLLFLVSFGMVEFGGCFYIKNNMEGAAREGCRAGIVTGATTALCNNAVENQLQVAGLVPSGTSASASGNNYLIGNYTVSYMDNGSAVTNVASVPVGDTLTTQIQATWGTVGSNYRILALMPASKLITCASAMRKEGQ